MTHILKLSKSRIGLVELKPANCYGVFGYKQRVELQGDHKLSLCSGSTSDSSYVHGYMPGSGV